MNESEGAVYVDEGAQDLSFVEEALNCEVENNASTWRWGAVEVRRKEFVLRSATGGRGREAWWLFVTTGRGLFGYIVLRVPNDLWWGSEWAGGVTL